MISDALLVLDCLFDSVWRLFTSWHIPGTETTPAAFILFVGVCGLALRFLYRIVGVNPDVGTVTISHTSEPGTNLPAKRE